MPALILLHTNDIHGRIDGLAQVATMVAKARIANPGTPVLYLDAGDVEDSSVRLSSLSKGIAMHRLLHVAGCDAAAVGNGGILRYTHAVLPDYASFGDYPLLLANLRTAEGDLLPGVQAGVLIDTGDLMVGLIGITTTMDGLYGSFGLVAVDPLQAVRDTAASLRQDGAHVVILLSHMGLDEDRLLAEGLQEDVQIIIGAHSHHLLPQGEQIGTVLIAQAGNYAEHLGRITLDWRDDKLVPSSVAVLPVDAATTPSKQVLDEVQVIENEAAQYLDTEIGELAAPLDFATDRECGVGNLMADALRQRMQADVAVVCVGQAFAGPLPGGKLRRGQLWDVCSSPANPCTVTLTGAQLSDLIRKGLDPAVAADAPRPLRGLRRGLLHLSGALVRGDSITIGGAPIEPDRQYRVAGSDWELEPYGGYMPREWNIATQLELPTILREAVEDYLAAVRPVSVDMGRLG